MNSQTSAENYCRRVRRIAGLCEDAIGERSTEQSRQELADVLNRFINAEVVEYDDLIVASILSKTDAPSSQAIVSFIDSLEANELHQSDFELLSRLLSFFQQHASHSAIRLRSR